MFTKGKMLKPVIEEKYRVWKIIVAKLSRLHAIAANNQFERRNRRSKHCGLIAPLSRIQIADRCQGRLFTRRRSITATGDNRFAAGRNKHLANEHRDRRFARPTRDKIADAQNGCVRLFRLLKSKPINAEIGLPPDPIEAGNRE